VKRVDLVRHVEAHGCALLREGGNHSVFVNRAARRTSVIPRHRDGERLSARGRSVVIWRFRSHDAEQGVATDKRVPDCSLRSPLISCARS